MQSKVKPYISNEIAKELLDKVMYKISKAMHQKVKGPKVGYQELKGELRQKSCMRKRTLKLCIRKTMPQKVPKVEIKYHKPCTRKLELKRSEAPVHLGWIKHRNHSAVPVV